MDMIRDVLTLTIWHVTLAFGFQCEPSPCCPLSQTLSIPENTTSIPESSFFACQQLSAVTLPSSLKVIGKHAFMGSGLSSVVVGDSVTTIEEEAFASCPLTSLVIGSSVTYIGHRAFQDTSIASVVLPGPGITLGSYLFLGCVNLTTVVILDSATFIGGGQFNHCRSLSSVVLGNSFTILRHQNFHNSVFHCEIFQGLDGRKFYFDLDAGMPVCTRCPDFAYVVFNLSSVCIFAIIAILCVARLAYFSATAHDDPIVVRIAAASSYVMSTCHILHLIVADVPWPPRLAAFLRVLDFLSLHINIARVECSFDRMRLQLEILFALYAVPVFLGLIYGGVFAFKLTATGDSTPVTVSIRKCSIALLTSLYWMLIWLLKRSWLPYGCAWWKEAEAPRRQAHLLRDATVHCSQDDFGWTLLISSGSLGLLVFQFVIPVYMVVSARQPHMAFATSPYKDRWKRKWLIADLAYRTAIALIKTFTAIEGVSDSHGRKSGLLQMREVSLIVLSIIYVSALLLCRPYTREVLACADAAPFFTILMCEMTKMSFAVAALLMVQSRSAVPELSWYAQPAKDHHSLEVFLIVTFSLWVLLGVYLVWTYRLRTCVRSLKVWQSDRSKQPVPIISSSDAPRRDLGTFTPEAKHAVISAPGATAPSFEVKVKRSDGAWLDAVIMRNSNGQALEEPPMLKRGETWAVRLTDSGDIVDIDAGDLCFAGVSEYEFWSSAINRHHFLDDFSFACVWTPSVQGHCRRASTFETWVQGISDDSIVQLRPHISKDVWSKYQSTLPWICSNLATGYGRLCRTPPCDNCAWFDFWAINVIRCRAAGQRLRFAYLPLPLYDDQPQFFCTASGHEGYYYVGIAQKVELEWAQDQMQMIVEPISFISDLMGSEEAKLRVVAKVVVAQSIFYEEAECKEIHERVDSMLHRRRNTRRLAQRRRKLHRTMLIIYITMGITLSIFCIEAGVRDQGNRLIEHGHQVFRAFNILIGSGFLVSSVALGFQLKHIFRMFNRIFELEDRDADDEFYNHISEKLRSSIRDSGLLHRNADSVNTLGEWFRISGATASSAATERSYRSLRNSAATTGSGATALQGLLETLVNSASLRRQLDDFSADVCRRIRAATDVSSEMEFAYSLSSKSNLRPVSPRSQGSRQIVMRQFSEFPVDADCDVSNEDGQDLTSLPAEGRTSPPPSMVIQTVGRTSL